MLIAGWFLFGAMIGFSAGILLTAWLVVDTVQSLREHVRRLRDMLDEYKLRELHGANGHD